jgi:hypothetical protein
MTELAVVLGSLALLAGLLLPAYASATRQSTMMQCKANLGQVGRAIEMYARDHQDYLPGPLWAIFDAGALDRDGWDINPPFTSDSNGCFFTADTIEDLATRIHEGSDLQTMPLQYLTETVEKWNAAVDAGVDEEFGRGPDAPMHKIDTPPFYAASISPVWHDSYGGVRINGQGQVIDMRGEVIPGLYAGGESSGGGNQHGLGRCLVHGYICGTNAVTEPSI